MQDDTTSQNETAYTSVQLRRAKRKARSLGLEPKNGKHAIELLRERGIDIRPAENAAVVNDSSESVIENDDTNENSATDLVTQENQQRAMAIKDQPKPPQMLSAEEREFEIYKIEKALKDRRRRKAMSMLRRLFLFVAVPTVLFGIYFYVLATPMYEAKVNITIQQVEAPGGLGGGLLSGTSFAKSEDAIAVQGYLQSREAAARIGAETDFAAHYSNPDIDSFKRIPENPSEEDIYSVYRDFVSVAYDSGEGIIRIGVKAYTREAAEMYTSTIMQYAEEKLNEISVRKRIEQVKGAQENLNSAKRDLDAARARIIEIQEKQTTLSPEADVQVAMAQISELETQLAMKRQILSQILANPSPNSSRVDGLELQIDQLQQQVSQLRLDSTTNVVGETSLAVLQSQMRFAESELVTQQMRYGAALESLSAKQLEAGLDNRFLAATALPIASGDPVYPKKFSSTLITFFIFFALYLFGSLTIAVLKEQMS